MDGVLARGEDGRCSGLFVHLDEGRATYELAQLAGDRAADCGTLLKLDAGTGAGISVKPANGIIDFEGYGVAVLTNAAEILEDAE